MEQILDLWLKYYPVYLSGLWGTLWISAVTVLFGTVLGMLIALMRMSKCKPVTWLAGIYIEILRGTPILVQLYFFWIGLPKLIPFELSNTACILVALIINASAYIAEIIRAGIGAVDKGQWEAAMSIGLSSRNIMQHVILPQAVKNILPTMGNEFIALVKETSVVSFVGAKDLYLAFQSIGSGTYEYMVPYLAMAIIYIVIVCLITLGIKIMERRLRKSDRGR